MFSEGAPLDALESVDSRRYLPHALAATAAVIVAPALVVIPLSPFAGIPDLLLSALLATGLSAAAGSVCAALWTQRPQSREISFGDLLLWSWARRVHAERRFAKAVAESHGEPRRSSSTGGVRDELAALRRLSVVFEARDASTHGHTGRVTRHAERIAKRLGLPESEVAKIRTAAAVHDVGKVGLPRSVLAGEGGSLTPEQQALLERHAVDGAAKVAAAGDPEVAAIVRHHHERIDGTGYPDGLAGNEIPLGARIVAVADAFDRLVSPEPGRAPLVRRRNALDRLCERAGSQLDAAAVAAFVDYYSGKRAIAGVAFAATAPQRLVRWVAAAPAGIGATAPPIAQGVCAAGALALAGSCLTTLPAPGAGGRADDRPSALVEREVPLTTATASLSDRSALALDVRSGAGERSTPREHAAGDGGSRQDRAPDGGGGTGGDRSHGSPSPGGGSPPPSSSAPANGGDTPASTHGGPPSEGAPSPAPAQPSSSPPPKPPPASPAPAAPAPSAPASPSPTTVLDPVVDQVHQVLDPLPTEQLTDPVERLLGNTLGR